MTEYPQAGPEVCAVATADGMRWFPLPPAYVPAQSADAVGQQ